MFVAFVSADTQHQFNARESDWGFTSFMPLSELYSPSRGYLVNDTELQEGAIPFIYILGSYCTSLIIFSCFKAVYHMPTTKNDMPSGSIPLALQNLFHKLQYSDSSVATKQLKIAFYCR